MTKNNYLVAAFVGGKYVNSYFSENLDDLVTIKAIHRDCEISIFNILDFSTMPADQVEAEIKKSGERWKKSLQNKPAIIVKQEKPVTKPQVVRKIKYWERSVRCVETGQVFRSVRDCCEKTGIPYMTIVNCIKNKNATRGVHFVDVTPIL